MGATVTLCLFWTAPVTLISALTEVNALKQLSPVLAGWVETYPQLEDVLALLAPLLLLILQDVLLPEFLRWFAAWEGHTSSSTLEAAIFTKYGAFVLVQTFFVSTITGSISAQLLNIVAQPSMLIDLLANALPQQSNYFLQILVVAMVLTLSLELLRVLPLGSALVRKFVGPNLTEKERTSRWKFLCPLENPYEFEHANVSGSVVLYFMILLVYASLAPVTCFFVLICFFMMESCYRYQFYHNYSPKPDSGGKHWLGFLHILNGEMIAAELTLIGFLILKESIYSLPFMIPLITITVLFIFYINTYMLPQSSYLPSSECVEIDRKYRRRDFTFANDVYMQPSLVEAKSDDIIEII